MFSIFFIFFFFFNDTATTEIYTLSLHDALPISASIPRVPEFLGEHAVPLRGDRGEQPGLVPEVIRRRRVADPGPPGHLSQAHGRGAGLPDCFHGRAQQRGPEVPVMVGTGRLWLHPPILVDIWPLVRLSFHRLDHDERRFRCPHCPGPSGGRLTQAAPTWRWPRGCRSDAGARSPASCATLWPSAASSPAPTGWLATRLMPS